MFSKKVVFCLSGMLVAFTCSHSFANDAQQTAYNQHQGPYLGGLVGIGLGAFRDRDGSVNGGLVGVGGTVFAGYQFNTNFSLEGDFVGMEGPLNTSFLIYGATLRAYLPIKNRFGLYVKAGGGAVRVKVCNIFDSDMCVAETKAAGIVGAGATYAFTPNVELALDYTAAINSNNGADGVYGILGLGIIYNFSN